MNWNLITFILGKSKFRKSLLEFLEKQEGFKLGSDCYLIYSNQKELDQKLNDGEWHFAGNKNKKDKLFVVPLSKIRLRILMGADARQSWQRENPRQNRNIQFLHPV